MNGVNERVDNKVEKTGVKNSAMTDPDIYGWCVEDSRGRGCVECGHS